MLPSIFALTGEEKMIDWKMIKNNDIIFVEDKEKNNISELIFKKTIWKGLRRDKRRVWSYAK